MRKKCEFDERQLLLRGNVFQHTTILLFALLLANGILKSCDITWAPGFYENILILWAGIALAIMEYILRDIAPRSSSQNCLYILEGILGLILFVMCLSHDVLGGKPLTQGPALTEGGAHLVVSILMLSIGVVFLAKRLWDRRRDDAADEE